MINNEQFEAEVVAMERDGLKVEFTLSPAQAVLLAVLIQQCMANFTMGESHLSFSQSLVASIQEQFPKGCYYTHRVIEQGGLEPNSPDS